jgi:hypothetical protein
MKAGVIFFCLLILLGGGLLVLAPGGLADHLTIYNWRTGGSDAIWPDIEHMDVTAASAEGFVVSVARGFGLGTDYHREGIVTHFSLDEVPADGRLALELEWSGEAEHGPSGSDWRGILMVDKTETRMCEQTIFCPQVPTARQGPAIQRSSFSLAVTAPAAWEIYAPGQPVGTPEVVGERKTWRFASEQPGLFSIVGGGVCATSWSWATAVW